MPQPRTTMRKTREIIRLHFECGLSGRKVAKSVNLSAGKTSDIIRRAKAAGLTWPLESRFNDDSTLEDILYPELVPEPEPYRPVPDWDETCRELRRKGVTRELLWQEYKAAHPDGYEYSRYCELLRNYKKHLEPVLRQEHRAGEKLFVDWAGLKMTYFENGCKKEASIFVAAMGASNYTFAQVYRDEKQANWNLAHIECFEFLGGIPELIVPDNTKTGVTKPSYYEPDLNPNYSALISHYGAAVLPARPAEPTDKAKVETAVQIVERWVIAPLRKMVFHSFGELRQAVNAKLRELNERPFQKLSGNRRQLFEEVDRPVLRPLPNSRYEMGAWCDATVYQDYHISIDRHFYSVPYRLIGERVSTRCTATTVEIYHKGNRVAIHRRSDQPGRATTAQEHRAPQHAAVIEMNCDKFLEKARKIGPFCEEMLRRTMDHFPHPEMGFRSCAGIIRLAKDYGPERTENACCRCLSMDLTGYKPLRNTLQNNLEDKPAEYREPNSPNHRNVRGPNQFRNNDQHRRTSSC